MAKPPEKGIIWKIDRFAIHDGPGIRTNIYFKGCQMRCLWCSNPEGQNRDEELVCSNHKCTGCGLCSEVCPNGALRIDHGIPVLLSAKCDLCGKCVSACSEAALSICGSRYGISDIMAIIERDRYIYRRSGGGITCTGGEPLLQAQFARSLLSRCSESNIHTAVETCGYVKETDLRDTLPYIDWLFFDLKHIDDNRHREFTGRENGIILSNLKMASSFFADMGRVFVIRQVIVPGLNDGMNIEALAEFVKALPHVSAVELLPYHAYGSHKYQWLGRKYQLCHLEPPSPDALLGYREVIESHGITCTIGQL